MNAIKILCFFITVSEVSVISKDVEVPLKQNSHQTAANQQGGAVVFFAAHQGMLRELLFNPVIFNQALVNQGSGYDNNTGVFTVPLDGIYQFVFAAQLCRGNHNNFWAFMVNGVQKMLCHAQVTGGDTSLNTCYFIEEMKKGVQIWIKQFQDSCPWSSTTSKTIPFSGVLLVRGGASMLGGKYGSCPLSPLSFRQQSSSAEKTVSLSCCHHHLSIYLVPAKLIMAAR